MYPVVHGFRRHLLKSFLGSDGLRLRFIPLHRPAQTFLKINQHFVTKVLLGQRDIGERVFNVAAALGLIFHQSRIARQFLQRFESLVQRDTAAGGAVEHASRTFGCGCGAGQQICLKPRYR